MPPRVSNISNRAIHGNFHCSILASKGGRQVLDPTKFLQALPLAGTYRHHRQARQADQVPGLKERLLLDALQGYGTGPTAHSLHLDHDGLGVVHCRIRPRPAQNPHFAYDCAFLPGVIIEHAIPGLHIAQVFPGQIVFHAIPPRRRVALQIGETVMSWLFLEEPTAGIRILGFHELIKGPAGEGAKRSKRRGPNEGFMVTPRQTGSNSLHRAHEDISACP
jgi:hypothetical protein